MERINEQNQTAVSLTMAGEPTERKPIIPEHPDFDYYPLGTVLYLKGGVHKVMILGRKQIAQDAGKVYDYLACLYPEGIVGPKNMYLFNKELIERVVSIGCVNEGEMEYQKLLREYDKANSKWSGEERAKVEAK